MKPIDLLCYVSVAVLVSQIVAFSARSESLVRVIDGDTFVMPDGEKVRIRGVDTPELRSKDAAKKRVAFEAQRELAKILNGGFTLSRTGKDKYGRTVADVQLRKSDAAKELIERGLGTVYIYKLRRDRVEELLSSQRHAQAKGIGLWAEKR